MGGLCQCVPAMNSTSVGCIDSADYAAMKVGGELVQPSGHRSRIPIYQSDDRQLDGIIGEACKRIARVFGVSPAFCYVDDESEGPHGNAWAVSPLNAPERLPPNPHGAVLLGMKMMRTLRKRVENPELAVVAICAHEYGHVVQFVSRGLINKIKGEQEKNRRVELQADYFAGYFAGRMKSEKPYYRAEAFASTLFDAGDTNLTRPDHHGTYEQRRRAVEEGYNCAYQFGLSVRDVIVESADYVQRLY